MTGDRFVIEEGNGRWHWELWLSHDPNMGPIARSGRDYATRQGAEGSLQSFRSATRGAFTDSGEPRIEYRTPVAAGR